MRSVRLDLTPEDWRRLRMWAAEQLLGEEELIARLVRERLRDRPPTAY